MLCSTDCARMRTGDAVYAPLVCSGSFQRQSFGARIMWLLWLVTAVWAFSFSLIGVYLSGSVDSYLAVFIRVALAFLLFVPLLRPRSLTPERILALMAIGAVQIGMTYLLLYHAFLYLSVPELLLFTVFTPLWVTLIDELLLNRRHLPAR